MKYNCNEVLDYSHEYTRMCKAHERCENCPLVEYECDSAHAVTQQMVKILQEWSDNHPEMLRITKAEQNFLKAFKEDCWRIARHTDRLILYGWGNEVVELNNDMFLFIKERPWSIQQLLNLEVQDE